MSISEKYQSVQDAIDKKLSSLSRSRSDIELIAVSKKQSKEKIIELLECCLLYTSPSPRDGLLSRMPSSA